MILDSGSATMHYLVGPLHPRKVRNATLSNGQTTGFLVPPNRLLSARVRVSAGAPRWPQRRRSGATGPRTARTAVARGWLLAAIWHAEATDNGLGASASGCAVPGDTSGGWYEPAYCQLTWHAHSRPFCAVIKFQLCAAILRPAINCASL